MDKKTRINFSAIFRLLVIIGIIYCIAVVPFGKTFNTILWIAIAVYLIYLLIKNIKFYKFMKHSVEEATWGKKLTDMTPEEVKDIKLTGWKKGKDPRDKKKEQEGEGFGIL